MLTLESKKLHNCALCGKKLDRKDNIKIKGLKGFVNNCIGTHNHKLLANQIMIM